MENQAVKLTDRQKELIERMGVMEEKVGYTPAAARVQALLTISDETALTFDQIKDSLSLSKSATSNAINFLLKSNRLEYITKPGDRKRYFRTLLYRWKDKMIEETGKMRIMANMFREILESRTSKTEEFNSHLAELVEFMDFAHETILDSFENWKSKR